MTTTDHDDQPFEIVRNTQISELLERFAGTALDLVAEVTRRLPADRVRRVQSAFDDGGQLTCTAFFGIQPVLRFAVVDADGDEVIEIAAITQPAPAGPGEVPH